MISSTLYCCIRQDTVQFKAATYHYMTEHDKTGQHLKPPEKVIHPLNRVAAGATLEAPMVPLVPLTQAEVDAATTVEQLTILGRRANVEMTSSRRTLQEQAALPTAEATTLSNLATRIQELAALQKSIENKSQALKEEEGKNKEEEEKRLQAIIKERVELSLGGKKIEDLTPEEYIRALSDLAAQLLRQAENKAAPAARTETRLDKISYKLGTWIRYAQNRTPNSNRKNRNQTPLTRN